MFYSGPVSQCPGQAGYTSSIQFSIGQSAVVMPSLCHAVNHYFVLFSHSKILRRERSKKGELNVKKEKVLGVMDSFSFRHKLWLLPWVLQSQEASVSLHHDSLPSESISRLAAAVYLHLVLSLQRADC